jgi:RND family efflux transporter MFP subunit
VVISDLSKISIWAYAFEEDLGKLHGDQPWEVTLKAVPGKKYKGKISVVGAVVDPNQHTVLIQGTIPNPNEKLRGGMFATATVEVPAESNQVTVPTSALIDLDDRTIVYVESPKNRNEFSRRQVRVRDRLQGDAILSGGVQPGDSIVVRGALELHQKARMEAEGKTD